MAVIKRAESGSIARSAIVLDLGDIHRQATDMERQGRDKAQAILNEAKQERERILSGAAEAGAAKGHAEGLARGMKEGLEQGKCEGLAQARDRLDALAASWDAALAIFEQERDAMLQDARAETLAFASAVAERITRRVIEQNPDAVRDILESALALTIRPTRLLIEAHPDDLASVEEAAPALVARLAGSAHATTAARAELSRGSIIVRTEEGVIDATVETQLARLLETALPDRKIPGAHAPAPVSGENSETPGDSIAAPAASQDPESGEGDPPGPSE